uniref:Uncharacterized protein n=1 Tax=Kalanchoe fedtschenkoi TaxID=63787 RepID=A0A7N0ZTT9_KALFE
MDHHHQASEDQVRQNLRVDAPDQPPMLTRQTSASRGGSCLCSPTTHAGSFRCRLHRSPSLNRTKSQIDSAALQASLASKPVNSSTSVEAQ